MKKQTFIDLDESNTNEINFIIVGKPNSGKSTLFNNLLKEDVSPTGDEYGLTKTLFTNSFEFKDIKFVIHDTPGLRRKNKIYDKDETSRNQKVLKLINKIDAALLLIDATENFTKQDFRIADLALDRKKILFILFNKFDLIEDKKEFRNDIEHFLETNYSQHNEINIDYISALSNKNIDVILSKISNKHTLLKKRIDKNKLNNFLKELQNNNKLPRVKSIEIKPKYMVQTDNQLLSFKVFINSKKRAPKIFTRFFENQFRKKFFLMGVPINLSFISSSNPYSS